MTVANFTAAAASRILAVAILRMSALMQVSTVATSSAVMGVTSERDWGPRLMYAQTGEIESLSYKKRTLLDSGVAPPVLMSALLA